MKFRWERIGEATYRVKTFGCHEWEVEECF